MLYSIYRLMSQFWYNTTNGCMSFYYHMKGVQQGTLAFGVKPYNQPLIRLTKLTGDQGDKWKKLDIEIGYDPLIKINTTFQFVFEAVVGGAVGKCTVCTHLLLYLNCFNGGRTTPCLI